MQRYQLVSPCVKCGCKHLDPKTLYQCGVVSPFGEYIQRTCRRCKYRWREETLDTLTVDTIKEGFMKGDEECTSE